MCDNKGFAVVNRDCDRVVSDSKGWCSGGQCPLESLNQAAFLAAIPLVICCFVCKQESSKGLAFTQGFQPA